MCVCKDCVGRLCKSRWRSNKAACFNAMSRFTCITSRLYQPIHLTITVKLVILRFKHVNYAQQPLSLLRSDDLSFTKPRNVICVPATFQVMEQYQRR